MSTKGRPSFSKRQKEQARQQARKRKDERREQRKLERVERADDGSAEDDPDIAGIVPGPQPISPEDL